MPDPRPILRHALLAATLQAETEVERVEVLRVELAPAQPAGLHRHPCPVVGWVIAGAIRFQVADGPMLILQAGDALHLPRSSEHRSRHAQSAGCDARRD